MSRQLCKYLREAAVYAKQRGAAEGALFFHGCQVKHEVANRAAHAPVFDISVTDPSPKYTVWQIGKGKVAVGRDGDEARPRAGGHLGAGSLGSRDLYIRALDSGGAGVGGR